MRTGKSIIVFVLLFLAAMGLIVAASGCKKEKKQTCGYCTYYEHSSYNDSLFVVNGRGEYCGEGYDQTSKEVHTWMDTISGHPNTVNSYFICKPK